MRSHEYRVGGGRGLAGVVVALILLTALGIGHAEAQAGVPVNFRVLHAFTGGTDGGFPYAGLVRDSADNVYGTTVFGGEVPGCNCDVVFRVSSTGAETVLYTFTGDPDFGGPNGSWPTGDLTYDREGNLYGTTTGDGTNDYGSAVVFKLDSQGNETVLYTFKGEDLLDPAGLIRDAAGNLYGVAVDSGYRDRCCGGVYRLDKDGVETTLHVFSGQSDGSHPWGDLVRDAQGNLYGTTSEGGPENHGVVFRVDAKGNFSVLHAFNGMPDDGSTPYAGLLPDGAGGAFGTTCAGGQYDHGTVFKIGKTGQVTLLYSFTGKADGSCPTANLVRDVAGNLYGTTQKGGIIPCFRDDQNGCGVVFRLARNGKESVLHAFTDGADGAFPGYGRLAIDSRGALFGTTIGGGSSAGVVYVITP